MGRPLFIIVGNCSIEGRARANEGFIQNFLVGVGKTCIEPRPLGGCGVTLPQEILEIYML